MHECRETSFIAKAKKHAVYGEVDWKAQEYEKAVSNGLSSAGMKKEGDA